MPVDPHANGAYSVVAVAPSTPTGGTTLSVSAGDGSLFPDPASVGAYNIAVWPNNAPAYTKNNGEIIRVGARSGDGFSSLTRAQEGSTARGILVGDQIALAPTNKAFTDIERAIGLLAAGAPATVSNTVATTLIQSYAVPAGDMRISDAVRSKAFIQVLNGLGTTQTCTLTFTLGATNVFSYVMTLGPGEGHFLSWEWTFQNIGAVNAQNHGLLISHYNNTTAALVKNLVQVGTSAINLAGSQNVLVFAGLNIASASFALFGLTGSMEPLRSRT